MVLRISIMYVLYTEIINVLKQHFDVGQFIPFIRWQPREEMRRHYAAVASGLPGEPEYAAGELRAFKRLRENGVKLY